MDLEQLTKSQIILLTLLVSFVTSIATGIVTVTLMDQAPPTVTQTINRVVERTVERVVPSESQVANVVTRERTVVVKESELIAQAVSRISPSLVALHIATEDEDAVFVSRGAVIAPGIAVVGGVNINPEDVYTIALSDGTSAKATVLGIDTLGEVAFIGFDAELYAEDPAAFTTAFPTLGQSIVGISGEAATRIASGIVTAFARSDIPGAEEDEPKTQVTGFEINVATAGLVPGTVITNTDGAVLGLYGGVSDVIVPAPTILDLLSSLSQQEEQTNAGESEGNTTS